MAILGQPPRMLHRPLIPILLSFIAGILVSAHGVFPAWPEASLLILLFIAICLFIVFLPSSRLSFLILLPTFFLSGILLNIQKEQPSRLLPFASRRDKVTIEGTILEPARINDKIAKFKVSAHGLFTDEEAIQVNENVMVTVYDHVPDMSPGEKIRFSARLGLFKNFNNPGRYDYESAMKLKKVSCSAYVSDGRRIVPMGPGRMPFPHGLLEKFRRPIRDLFEEKLDAQGYALYRALILGERQGIGGELREPFNQTGLGHVLAVSGLHIGLVAWLAFFFFRGVLSRSYSLALKTDIRKLAAILTCLPVLGYAFVAGFQVSSQRAMIMALTFLCSMILGRGREIWSTLALAGLFVLVLDPMALFSISFQLSFSAVIGILWLTPAILAKLPHSDDMKPGIGTIFHNRISYYFIGLIAVSLSATIILLPQIALLFHRIPLVGILANVTVTPILGLWVIPLGLVSAASLPLSSVPANFFLQLGAWGLNVMMEIVRFWADLPWSDFWIISPNSFEIFMYYALIFLLFFFRRWSWVKVGGLVLVVFILADIGYWVYRVSFAKELRITFIDVGQGNSALVEFPGGKKMLIDGGGFPRDHFDVGKMVVAPYLWHSKISSIDYMVLSHPQADHMNGLRFIARTFHPKEFWHNGDMVETAAYGELMDIIDSKAIKKILPSDLSGGRKINGVNVEILHPRPGGYPLGLNDNSLVLRISYEGKSFLFPGDLERPGERIVISNAGDMLQSDVLLSPHHGSKGSSSKEFLRIVQPDICVISCREGNFFGFPHQNTLKGLREIGCGIIRIGQAGAVQFVVGPRRFSIRTFVQEKRS